MCVLSITFRMPEGERISEERLEQLAEMGVDPDDVCCDRDGEMSIRLGARDLSEGGDLFTAGEDFAEEVEAGFDDMTLLDMKALA